MKGATLRDPPPDSQEMLASLRKLQADSLAVLDRVRPDCVAVERLFFAKNRTSAMDVAKALGVVMLAAAQRGLECAEYSPSEVKLSVVGNGAADKAQVAYMVVKLLGLAEPPRPDDVADALAVAVTHALRAQVPR